MPPPTTSKLTTDHEEIQRWAKERDAMPATISEAEKGDSPSVLRLKLPGRNGGVSMKATTWDTWLKKFDQQKLAFLYQDRIANGEPSDYNEIVSRAIADEVENAVGGKGRSASRRGSLRSIKFTMGRDQKSIPAPPGKEDGSVAAAKKRPRRKDVVVAASP